MLTNLKRLLVRWSGVKGLQLEGTSPALFYLFVAWVATSCIDTVVTVAALKARAEWKSENQAPADANVFPDQYKIVFFFWKPRSHPQSLSYESADPAKSIRIRIDGWAFFFEAFSASNWFQVGIFNMHSDMYLILIWHERNTDNLIKNVRKS